MNKRFYWPFWNGHGLSPRMLRKSRALFEQARATPEKTAIIVHRFTDLDAIACGLAGQEFLGNEVQIYQGDGRLDGIELRLPEFSQGLFTRPIAALPQDLDYVFLFDASSTEQGNVGAPGVRPDLTWDTHQGDLRPNATQVNFISQNHVAVSSIWLHFLRAVYGDNNQFWWTDRGRSIAALLGLGIYTDSGELDHAKPADLLAWQFAHRCADHRIFDEFHASPFWNTVHRFRDEGLAQHNAVESRFFAHVGALKGHERSALGAAADEILRRIDGSVGSVMLAATIDSEDEPCVVVSVRRDPNRQPRKPWPLKTLMHGVGLHNWSAHSGGLVAGGLLKTNSIQSALVRIKQCFLWPDRFQAA